MTTDRPAYRGGTDIAMKLPPHLFEATERFYLETLGLPVIRREPDSIAFEFGANRLWLDRVPNLEHPEVWLEVVTRDRGAAERHLRSAGVTRCDEVEPLPEGFRGFWIKNPARVVHLVVEEGQ